ncbi:BTAD domain-containing putative transcriptional regulator [Streptosporangium sp. NPDC050280]|uniref:BTAD domain-containing putative transcriptional regulator n=1 Tax=unclassified Streptosporangium TaxID=2632669 RepID=UPI0034414B2A
MTLGDLLLAYRKRAGITQNELAARAGVGVRTLRDIEQGVVKRPHTRSVRKLAEAAGLSVTDLDAIEKADRSRSRRTEKADRSRSQRTEDADRSRSRRTEDPILRIELLGPLTIRLHGRTVDLEPPMQRRLLGLLALQANRVVTQADIVDFLWGEEIPPTYQNLVHTHVSRLRKFFENIGMAEALISRTGAGYLLTLSPDRSDLLEFADTMAKATAHRTAGEREEAERAYEKALSMWLGEILADLTPRARHHPVVVAVSQQRLTAVLDYADLAMDRGHHRAALERLRDIVHTEPLHEGLNARIMLALAASGRRAAALRLFGDLRDQLADNLGIEPSPELRDAYLRILRQEIGTAATWTAPRLSRADPVPAQLPPDIATFTGRDRQTRELDTYLTATDPPPTAARVLVVTGTAGVGKTALAVHWSHQVRHRFTDGQLYYNLHGYSDNVSRTAEDALTAFLLALGVSPSTVPLDVDARTSLFRSMMVDRRTLLVLDNVTGPDQIRPLITANPHSAVLVTSRNDLSGLKVHDDALIVELDVLDDADAVTLLTKLLRADICGTPPETVEELARLCGCLPLALRIAAANISRGTYDTVADYVAALREGNRLTELAVDGEDTAVETAFALSYAALPPRAARLFRLLGLFPGSDVSLRAVAALAGANERETAAMLGQLVRAHLVQRRSRDRYQMHDLLRLFAAQRCAEVDDERERDDARRRLLEHYLDTARQATGILYPGMLRLCELPGKAPATWENVLSPLDWLAAERANLAAAVRHAAERGPRAVAWRLTDVLRGYLWRSYDVSTWCSMAEAGLDAARHEGDRQAEAAMHYSLGAAYRYGRCHLDKARLHLDRAQRMFGDHGEVKGRAGALDSLGMVFQETGETDRALAALGESLELCRRTRLPAGQTKVLCNLGLVSADSGRIENARRYLAEALSLARRLGDRHMEAMALHNLGHTCQRDDRFEEAIQHYERALAIRDDIGDAEGKGTTFDTLGTLMQATGRYARGRRYWYKALAAFEEIGHPSAADVRSRLSPPCGLR